MSNLKLNNMETRNVTIILEKAREWFYSEDASLKEIALQAFNREHLCPIYPNTKEKRRPRASAMRKNVESCISV